MQELLSLEFFDPFDALFFLRRDKRSASICALVNRVSDFEEFFFWELLTDFEVDDRW